MNTTNITIICMTVLIAVVFFMWANSHELVHVKGYETTIKINKLTGHKCTALNPLNLKLNHKHPPLCND